MKKPLNPDFHCLNCRAYVHSNPLVSGVRHRNHCPYCLWSRHLDLLQPGDRLSACKALMMPVGLTFKRTIKKYGNYSNELMVSHRCVDCRKVSINRIAADDQTHVLLSLVRENESLQQDFNEFDDWEETVVSNLDGIVLLNRTNLEQIEVCLLGISSMVN